MKKSMKAILQKNWKNRCSANHLTQGYQIDPNASLRSQVHTSSFFLNAWEEGARHLLRTSTLLSWMDPTPELKNPTLPIRQSRCT